MQDNDIKKTNYGYLPNGVPTPDEIVKRHLNIQSRNAVIDEVLKIIYEALASSNPAGILELPDLIKALKTNDSKEGK